MALTIFGVAWIGLAFAHGVLLRELPHGGGILVDILVGTFVGDSGAYLGGRWFGQRKLAPRVSPNKTVEGLVIGMLTAVLATWLAGTYQDWLSGTDAILLGARRRASPRRSATSSSPSSSATPARRTRAACSARTAARWTASTPCMFTVVVGYYIWLALL